MRDDRFSLIIVPNQGFCIIAKLQPLTLILSPEGRGKGEGAYLLIDEQ